MKLTLTNGVVGIDASQAKTNWESYTNDKVSLVPNYYKATIETTNTTGTATFNAVDHKCGLNPFVQVRIGDEIVEFSTSIDGSGNVTLSWNGTLSSQAIVIIVGK